MKGNRDVHSFQKAVSQLHCLIHCERKDMYVSESQNFCYSHVMLHEGN